MYDDTSAEEHFMKRLTLIPLALACALGAGTAPAQSVQRGDALVSGGGERARQVTRAPATAPIQVAQAGGSAGGAASGAATGAAVAGPGVVASALMLSVALSIVAVTAEGSPTVAH
jgi:hypothetical protein